MLNRIRMILKILLCISVIVAFVLTSNYLLNLDHHPEGFRLNSMIARWVYGDSNWTLEVFYNGFRTSAAWAVTLFIINLIFDIIALKKPKVKPE